MIAYRISADALLQLAIFARGSSSAYSASILALLKEAVPIADDASMPAAPAEPDAVPEADDEPADKIAKPE